jgi:ectoine hydroxylase-related dioxygenase (phytanoyl-CoA dioxygenase family)
VVYQLTDEALAAYERDGFLVIAELIPPEETTRLRSTLSSLHEQKIGFKEGALFDAVGLDDGSEQRFPQIINPSSLAPELKKSEYYEVALSIAKQILGKGARIRGDISFLKPPRIGSHTPWHQDEAFGNPMYEYRQLSIWLALTPADSKSSCMSFVPGSHNSPVLEHRPLGGDPRVHALECVGDFDPSKAVECPLLPGGCTIHDHRTLHYAGPNYSDQARLAYVVTFDTAPVLRKGPAVDFPWRKYRKMTARASRENSWRQRGGLFVFAWRQRDRLGHGMADLRRIKDALIAMISG